MKKTLRIVGAGLLLTAMLLSTFVGIVLAKADQCEITSNSVKIDGLSGTSFTYTAPDGYLVSGWCYKASTELREGTVTPPAKTVTITSSVTNKNGQIQDLSNAVFYLVTDTPKETPTSTPTEGTPTEGTPTSTPTEGTPTEGTPTEGTPTIVPTTPVVVTETPVEKPKWTCPVVDDMLVMYPIDKNTEFWDHNDTALRFYNKHCTKSPVSGAGVLFVASIVALAGLLALMAAKKVR